MTGEFVFKLLNPAMSLVFALTFLMLALRRLSYRYPLLLALAFLLIGIAFAANDFLRPYDGPALRIAVNGLFTAAVLSACISAYVRVGAKFPTALFCTLLTSCAVAFCWFLIVEPSTLARIYVVNMTFAAMALITAWSLVRAKPRSAVDWLFVAFSVFLFLLAVARPVATFLEGLDTNMQGSLSDSVYWASIQALTPVLALTLAVAFATAFALQVFSELRDEAARDHLTGLLNRRGFEIPAETILQSNAREDHVAVMIADIDNFKYVNDTFGHAVGDRTIIAVAQVLAGHGSADLVARFGGEEFALLFRNANRGGLLAVAGLLRTELQHLNVEGLPAGYRLTISIGIHPRNGSEALADMIARADEALYVAKTGGKDQAIMTTPFLRPMTTAQVMKSRSGV